MSYSVIRFNKPSKVFSDSIRMRGEIPYEDMPVIKAFTVLMELMPLFNKGELKDELNAKFHNDIGDKFYQLEPSIAQALANLAKEIKAGLHNAYLKGKADGKNILIQLSNGDLTMDEFDKK